jgi:hypothetical protein
MQLSSDLLHQLTDDRAHDLRAPAAARRLAGYVPARRRVAQSLRRAADRLDDAAVPPGSLAQGRGSAGSGSATARTPLKASASRPHLPFSRP